MDKKVLFLSIGMVLLLYSYIQTFSIPQQSHNLIIAATLASGLVAAILFFISYRTEKNVKNKGKGKNKQKIDLYIIAWIALILALSIFQLVAIVVVLSIIGIYATGRLASKEGSYKMYAIIVIGIMLTSAAASAIFVLHGHYIDSDETAYNYYASYLLLHGTNPYTSSMKPILQLYNSSKTALVNGTYEYKYNYPALSLLPALPLAAYVQPTNLNFGYFQCLIVLISTIAAYILYMKSKYKRNMLLILALWLAATYLVVYSIDQYIAVGIFLLLAYMERKNIIASGILVGLAASTIQLAWFALPFLYILSYREQELDNTLKSIGIALLVFLLINGYFIAVSPRAFVQDTLLVFRQSELSNAGPTISLLLSSAYPVGRWVPQAISVIALLVFMVLLYLYTSTLKPLVALAPMFIFFLSWENLQMYGLAFIPLLVYICYIESKGTTKDIIRSRRYMVMALAALVIVSLLMVVYGHILYT